MQVFKVENIIRFRCLCCDKTFVVQVDNANPNHLGMDCPYCNTGHSWSKLKTCEETTAIVRGETVTRRQYYEDIKSLHDVVKQARFKLLKKEQLTKEEKELLAILMINAMQTENRDMQSWYCDNDCYGVNQSYCLGEHGVVKGAKVLCPFYSPEDK